MYLDFEDCRPETPRVEPAISPREGVLISLVLHACFGLVILFAPTMMSDRDAEAARQLALQRARAPEDNPRFVFVQPRVDRPVPRTELRADPSDADRLASSAERPPDPRNVLPFARGNSTERVEADPQPATELPERPEAPAEAIENAPTNPSVAAADPGSSDPTKSMLRLPDRAAAAPALDLGRGGAPGSARPFAICSATCSRSRSDNARGGADARGAIQFDTKASEFGPWLRRFVAQVKRNWFIPYAVWGMKGRVVITFIVHKNGALTDVDVKISLAPAPSTMRPSTRSFHRTLRSRCRPSILPIKHSSR